MNKLTRDEFEALVTRARPVATLPDGSNIELTICQALRWFDTVESFSRPSFVLDLDHWVHLGEELENHNHKELYQVGGRE